MTLNEALMLKTEKRTEAIDIAEEKRRHLHAVIPRIKAIDDEIMMMPIKAISGESVEKLRENNDRLLAERDRLLTAAGFDTDYDAPVFECSDCNDSGYIGLKLCPCIKNLIAEDNYSKRILAKGLDGKTFDNFSLDYYEGSAKTAMTAVLDSCKRYTKSFPKAGAGLLFWGGTGLGKTHLSAAIASEVAKKGYSVIYESAQNIFDTYDAVRFSKKDESEKKRFESCDLLLIDDLGAECVTQYSAASFTNLLNLRMVLGLQTVISTNLTPDKIRNTYGERVLSRLLGEFTVLGFEGKDIRLRKKGARK